ncbi:hypothetical protein A6P54_12685 [Bacillus sp. MKU004]|nr:hypothetical protein A6P54_12685 [Bacillus sp. MKU004]
MKKPKIFWTLSIMAVVIVGGTLYYFTNIKSYETEDVEVNEIVSSDYEVKLPGENEAPSTLLPEDKEATEGKESKTTNKETKHQKADGSDMSSKKETNSSQTSLSHPGKSSSPSEPNSKGTEPNTSSESPSADTSGVHKVVTSDTILNKYKPSFEDIEVQANQKVNELISYAVKEYKDKKENGEEISYFYFYSKYSLAGKTLESNTDDSFNYIYGHLENELKKNGFDEKSASIFKDKYKEMKKQRKAQLMSKGMDALK